MKSAASAVVLLAAGIAANVAVALLLLGIGTLLLSAAIWRQNRRGFQRLESLLLTKAAEGQAVIDEQAQ